MTETQLEQAKNLHTRINEYQNIRSCIQTRKGYVTIVLPFDIILDKGILRVLDQRIVELQQQFAAI